MPRITAKGRITIPAELRRKYGLLPGAEVEVVEKNGLVVIQLKGGLNRGPLDRRATPGKGEELPVHDGRDHGAHARQG